MCGKSFLGHSRGAQRGRGLRVRRWVTLLDPLFLGSRVEVVVPWEVCVTLLDPLFLGSRVEVVIPWEGCAISWYCVCNAQRA